MAHRSIQRITTVLQPSSAADLTNLTDVKSELGITNTNYDTWFGMVIPQITAAITRHCNRVFALQTYRDEFRLRRPAGALAIEGGADPLILSSRPVISVIDVFDRTGAPIVPVSATGPNNATTTLLSPMTNGQTTMPLTALLGSAFPFDVLIDTGNNEEVVTVTGLQGGTTYNVTRAQASTAAVAHAAGAPATQAVDPTLYEVDPEAAVMTRLSTDAGGNFWPVRWRNGPVAVFYSAGYVMPGQSNPTLPGDLEEAALRLAVARYRAKGRDPMLKSESDTGVIGAQQYWIGAAPGQTGVFPPEIEAILDNYRNVVI